MVHQVFTLLLKQSVCREGGKGKGATGSDKLGSAHFLSCYTKYSFVNRHMKKSKQNTLHTNTCNIGNSRPPLL